MGKWKYRKTEASSIRGICVRCNKNQQKRSSRGRYTSLCSSCDKELYRTDRRRKRDNFLNARSTDKKRRPYREHVKERCERCGFTPEHICQLDVHHKDGDHNNNDVTNLQTLCANCHRLEHFKGREKS